MIIGEFDPAYTSCGYCKQTYYESDTGYAEFGCTLGDNNPEKHPCYEEYCPLKCRWKVED